MDVPPRPSAPKGRRVGRSAVRRGRPPLGWLAPAASKATWDWDGFTAKDERQAQIVRDAGAPAESPIDLHTLAQDKAWVATSLVQLHSSRRLIVWRR